MKLAQRLKSFSTQSMRVWRIMKRPSAQEFKSISKVSALGILALGLLGFIFAVVMKTFI